MQSLENKISYLNDIFEKDENNIYYTKNAELFQDILKYFTIVEEEHTDKNQENVDNNNSNKKGKWISLKTEPHFFKIRELENWLMKNNRYFINLYSDSNSKTKMIVRITNNDKQIKNCLKNLESMKLINIKDYVEGDKNKIPTPRYELTIHGLIILIIIKYESTQFSQDRHKTNQMIIRYIQYYFGSYNSHICDFLSKIYDEMNKQGHSQLFIDFFIKLLHQNSHKIKTIIDALNLTLYTLLMSEKSYLIFKEIFINTLNGLEDEIKKIILYHEKAEIESRIHLSQPPKDWEVQWIENLHNYSNLTLYGKCKICYEKYPITIDYLYYRNNILPSNFLNIKCVKCNSEESFIVSSDLSKIT